MCWPEAQCRGSQALRVPSLLALLVPDLLVTAISDQSNGLPKRFG